VYVQTNKQTNGRENLHKTSKDNGVWPVANSSTSKNLSSTR